MENDFLNGFQEYLEKENKSMNTIKGYILNLKGYFKWFKDSFGMELSILHRQNIIDYKNYLINVKKLNSKTVNNKISALRKFNEFLQEMGVQKELVIDDKDMIKIQLEYASPTNVTESEVKRFMQKVLETNNNRNYALVILLAYTGLRISEALNLKMNEFNLITRECIVKSGKNNKQRTVILNSKVITALTEYLKERKNSNFISEYLFISNRNEKLSRITINQLFNSLSSKITPHTLRHFFCTNAIEKGMSIHEVAFLAGHSNIHTTLLYTNPDKQKIIDKLDLL